MILHANTIPQNRPARVGTGGIDRNNANRAIFFAIVLGQLIDQGTLAGTGRTGKAKNPRATCLRKQRL